MGHICPIGRSWVKAAPPTFCHHAFNSGATLLCVGDFSYKIVLHRAAKKNFDLGSGFSCKGGLSKFKFMIRPKQINK